MLSSKSPSPRRSKRPHVLAVASGKGGVGKTWFAITLAHALAHAGRRVLLLDADLGLANVDIQLGLMPRHDLSGVIAGTIGLADAITRCEAGGFDILPGRSGSGRLGTLDAIALERFLGVLEDGIAGYDVVLLDLGAGLDRLVRRLACWADRLIVVATDEPTSLTDAYAVMKLYRADKPGGVPALVVNQAASPDAGTRTHATLDRACANFLGQSVPLLGVIRRDEHVRDAIRRQTLLLSRHPACAAAEDVDAIARKLSRPVLSPA